MIDCSSVVDDSLEEYIRFLCVEINTTYMELLPPGLPLIYYTCTHTHTRMPAHTRDARPRIMYTRVYAYQCVQRVPVHTILYQYGTDGPWGNWEELMSLAALAPLVSQPPTSFLHILLHPPLNYYLLNAGSCSNNRISTSHLLNISYYS